MIKQKRIWLLLLVFAAIMVEVQASDNNKKPQRPPYKAHIRTARGFGLPAIKDNAQLKVYIKKKKLRSTTCNKGCTINNLTHSKPYLVPKANKVLNEISKRFYAKTKSTFTVTSITRTLHDQHRLTKVNENARHGLSSHNYGCSFDISYIRFNKKKGNNTRLEKALLQILTQFQQQGKIYFIKEKWQRCFHVTVKS